MKFRNLLALCLMVLVLSCDDEPAKVKETPFKSYLSDLELDLSLYTADTEENYSIGYEFEVKRSGNVVSLGAAVPVASAYTINLYEVSEDGLSGIEIAEATVTFTTTDIATDPFGFKYSKLSEPVKLTTGKKYRVAYHTADGQNFYRLEDTATYTLPLDQDSKQVKIIQGVFGDPGVFPTTEWDILYTADFTFEY